MDDADYVIEVIDRVFERYGSDLEAMPEPVRVFMLSQYFKAVVDNGGFGGFMVNPSGDRAEATLAALNEIGARESAALLSRACSFFPTGRVPDKLEERGALAEENDLDDKWSDLDDEFYSDPDWFDVRLKSYAQTHLQEYLPSEDSNLT